MATSTQIPDFVSQYEAEQAKSAHSAGSSGVPNFVDQYEEEQRQTTQAKADADMRAAIDTGATMRKYGYRPPVPPITAAWPVHEEVRTDPATGKPYDPNTAQASALVGHQLAPPAGAVPNPEGPPTYWTNPRTGQRLRLSATEADAIPILDSPITGSERLASGLGDIGEALSGPGPSPITHPKALPYLRASEPAEAAKARAVKDEQMTRGMAETLEGGMELGSPLMAASGLTAPLTTMAGLFTGLGLSAGAGAAVHGKVSPETERLIRDIATL